MTTVKKSAAAALKRGRERVSATGKVAKSAAVKAAKAGAAAAMVAGTTEFKKGMKSIQDAPKRRGRKIAAVVAGAAALTAAGVMIARRRSK